MVVLNIKKAFTLVELLVVISIIATLTAILLPNFMGARERAKDSQTKQDMVAIKNALRLFYNDTQNYPPTGTDLGTTLASYMPSVSGIGFGYTYAQSPGGDGFQLCSVMNSGSDDTTTSQLNCRDANSQVCGVGLTTSTSLYVVCAN
jgi:prepilin-type N-terminal cleavage/methylation domain-containing protein